MRICIVDERISYKCERALEKEGFYVIKLPPSPTLSAPLASHPDMLMFCHEKSIIAAADYAERFNYVFSDIWEYCENINITFSADTHKPEYPHDAIFNALTVEDKIFLKCDTVSKKLLDYAASRGLKVINTTQGYPACTTLAFGKFAITADKGMAKTLAENGISVTEIVNGGISLSPYEYGFIGGAAGVYKNKIYFLGDIMAHPDAQVIVKAISDAGFIPVSLSDEALCDLGRILFID